MGLNNKIRKLEKNLARMRQRVAFPYPGDDTVTLEDLADKAALELKSNRARRTAIRRRKRKSAHDRRM